MISKGVSRVLKPFLDGLRVGHVGTLDPAADGVLPILLGSATRLQDDLLEMPKTYVCKFELGYETESLDLDSEVQARCGWEHISVDGVTEIARSFKGACVQVPPIYSAVKLKGRPLYDYKRKGHESHVSLEALRRQVWIYSCDVAEVALPFITIKVVCSKGTYIRVLVKDFASRLHTLATVTRLQRIGCAGIAMDQCVSVEDLENLEYEQALCTLAAYLIPMDSLPLDLPRLQLVNEDCIKRFRSGCAVRMEAFSRDGITAESYICRMDSHTKLFIVNGQNRALGVGAIIGAGKSRFITMKRSLE
jgi:tRNA pseudouridine55 synthase